MDVHAEICKFLDSHCVSYEQSTHEAVLTSEQAAAIRGVDIKTGAKAMLVRSSGKFYLFVLSAARNVDYKKIKEILGVDGVSLATREEVEKVTHCVPGCVPPFGNLFGLTTYMDRGMLELDTINFSAGRLTHSMKMKFADWKRIVNPIEGDYSIPKKKD